MLAKDAQKLRREQLDRALTAPADPKTLPLPRRGWIREIREALGMSATQLARRLEVTQPAVAKMEKAEAAGTISLAGLSKAAEAMGCRLVYAFVPRTSLDEYLRGRAHLVAARLLSRVDHTMALEDQEGSEEARERRVRDLADELVRALRQDLWEEIPNDPARNVPRAERERE